MNPLLLPAILLGIVQGVTEFLPVSSTAHLAAVPQLLRWDHPLLASLPFDVALHVGTLGALGWAFAGEWRRLGACWRPGARGAGVRGQRALGLLLVTGTLPALAAGAIAGDAVSDHLRGLGAIALFLAAGAGVLWWAERSGRAHRRIADLGWLDVVLIGCAQACAILPGLSRSGMTMAAGRALGLGRVEATRFSFLLSAPVIAAAIVWEGRKLGALTGAEVWAVAAGIAAAGAAGLAAIRWLLGVVARTGLIPFVWYRLALAAILGLAALRDAQ